MQRSMKTCKNLAFWDIYEKRDDKLSGAIIGLRCPYWSVDCEHRETKDGKGFCRNFPMHEEIRREFKEKQEKEMKKNKEEPPDEKEQKKAA